MNRVEIAVAELREYPRNSRTHTLEQVDQVAASIKEFGWTVPIVVDENNMILAGHCRLRAALKLGLTTAPCVRVSGLTEAQRQAYVIADNKLALNAGWDTDILKSELCALQAEDFNLDVIGFSLAELDNIFGNLPEDEESGEPEDPKDKTYTVVVACDGEEHQQRVLDMLEREGYSVKPVVA